MKVIFLLFVGILCTSSLFGQKSKSLKAFLDYKTFYNPGIGNYVEIQVQFLAYSLNFKAVEGGLQANIAVQINLKQKETSTYADAYRLESPLMKDSIIEDFFDIKRIALPAGEYTMDLVLTDLNSKTSSVSAMQNISVPDLKQKIAISHILPAENVFKSTEETNFSKSGYEVIPRISNYYAVEATKIPIYLEIYHSDESILENEYFGLKQSIVKHETKQEIEAFTRFSKMKSETINPIIRGVDIEKLPSGEYDLTISVINAKNEELVQTSYYFERFSNEEYQSVSTENIVLDPNFQNSITDDSLDYFISSLIPISKPAEIKNIISLLKTKDKSLYRKYIQSYWTNSTSGVNVYEKWMNYKTQVWLCEKMFSTNFTDGHETDRGRVFLQYGPPNSITTRENSPSEYPYEIWRYDKIVNFSNKRFVFYNPDLVNNTYRLLHSDMRGELQNYRWQQQLSKRNATNSNIDDPNDGNADHYGGNSKTLYNEY